VYQFRIRILFYCYHLNLDKEEISILSYSSFKDSRIYEEMLLVIIFSESEQVGL
jgi:hypothetical protein